MRSCFQQLSLEHPFGPGLPLMGDILPLLRGQTLLIILHSRLTPNLAMCTPVFSSLCSKFLTARRCAYMAFANPWVCTDVTNGGF